MDMPLQHAHPDVLRAMRRPSNGERYLEIIDEFRARVPGHDDALDVHRRFPRRDRGARRVSRRVDRPRAARSRRLLHVFARRRHARVRRSPQQVPEREKRRRLLRLREAQRLASDGRARGASARRCASWSKNAERCGAAMRSRRRSGRAMSAWALDGRSARRRRRRSIFAERRQIGTFVDVRLEGSGPFDFFGRSPAGGGDRCWRRDGPAARRRCAHDRIAYARSESF